MGAAPPPWPGAAWSLFDTARDAVDARRAHELRRTIMADRQEFSEDDPRHHTIKLKGMLKDVAEHARDDVDKVDDPRAQALFETTAEVVAGLERAVEHFEQRSESAWR